MNRFRLPLGFAALGLLALLGACSQSALGPTTATPTAPAPASAPRPAAVAASAPVDPAHARNVFVMLSGGVTPLSNNYSQYLQAKAVATFLHQNYPADAVWTFFGAGNVEGQAPMFGDVLRRTNRDGLALSSWLPGSLSHNRPAKKEVILRALREEILPLVRDGGTLYLFVGDHGSQATTGEKESLVNLWRLVEDPKAPRGWREDGTENLAIADLRQALAAGLGRGRVVFCMTQCHSGGFHHLAVPREMMPNTKWFTKLPTWAVLPEKSAAPAPLVRAAGFTATDEFNLAAGCDPDPDPDKWAGYERFVPENLLGLDLFTLQPAGRRRASFYEAHLEATLVDRTIDKPYSTSEQYLERWADLIEKRLAKEPALTDAVKKQVAAYQRVVDGAAFTATDAAFRDRQALFARFTQRLTEQNTAVKDLLLTGTRKELDEATVQPGRGGGRGPGAAPATPATPAPVVAQQGAAPQGQAAAAQGQGGTQPQRGGRGPGRGGFTASPEVLKIWNETIRPAWKTAVEADKVTTLPVAARDFEKYLLAQEAKGKDFLFADSRTLPNEVFWRSGYANPATLDSAKAEAVARWGAERRTQMLAWAKASDNAALRDAVADLEKRQAAAPRGGQPAAGANAPASTAPVVAANTPARAPGQTTNVSQRPLSKKTAAERVLFYRRTLAAWEFLLAVDERAALDRIRELTELERTPLPASKT